MSDHQSVAGVRAGLAAAGMAKEDLDWLDRHGWNHAAIPPPLSGEIGAYQRREAALNAAIAELGINERGASLESRLAAAIGARLADLRDKDDED